MGKISRRVALGALVAAPFVYLGGRHLAALAADPTGPKSCLPPAGPVEAVSRSDALAGFTRGGFVNDASCLNATAVHGVVAIKSIEDIQIALAYARANGLTVSAAGVRHSMGGQAFLRGGLVLDMRGFNAIAVDAVAKTVTVQSGATWHQIQEKLHPLLAVKAMQSTDIFTVGGSISVNAHGMDHHAGAIMRTIREMTVVMADGAVRQVTPASEPELFRLIVGGYGLFGIIAEVTLEVTDNVIYRTGREIVRTADFPALYRRIEADPAIGLFYAHLSTAPHDFLGETLAFTYTDAGPPEGDLLPLGPIGMVPLRRLIFNLAKEGSLLAEAKWFAEKSVDPLFESCTVTRQSALASGEGACFVSRNEPMHDSVPYLMNALDGQTDILHEYFVPRASLMPFIDTIRPILASSGLPMLNASIRVVHKEENLLTYAPRDAFSVVLYINQPATPAGNEHMAALTRALIGATLDHGGRFFLPYQLHYTAEELRRSYPEIGEFFRLKRFYDPSGLFTNTFHRKYADQVGA
ncbi:MAG TPA: FAD-binding oxidoreductase [Bauldia sp.]|nr:FAD-binding oxidoreductase [Bauldia sp.]